MSELSQVEQLTKEIEKQIASVPETVLETILNNIPSDSHVGVSLRSDNSQALRERLQSLDMNDLGLYAQRLIHAAQALGQDDTLKHIPHAEGLIKVIDGVAGMAYESDEDDDVRERAFYEQLQTVAKVIPGVQSDGSPLAMEKLYNQEADPTLTKFDVLAQAHENLSADVIDEEDREYWEGIVRRNVPELRDARIIDPKDIPLSDASIEANDQAEAFNASLGKASGQLLNALYGSNRAEPNEPGSILTDTPTAPEVEAVESDDFGLDSVPVADPVDTTTPDFYEEAKVV